MERRRRQRLALLVLAALAAAGAVAAKLVQLQVLRRDELRARAERQHRRFVEVEAARGAILDRHRRPLAVSLATQALFVHPWRVQDPERAASRLAESLGLPRRELLSRLRSDKPFAWIDRFLEPDRLAAVRAAGVPLGNTEPFGLLPSSRRHYPHGSLGVHVVGFANIDGVGVEGVEQRFDERLRGDPSVYLVLQDGRSGHLRELVRAPGSRAHDVVLTLDLVLQHVVERELERAMRETGAQAASAILLEPATGQVLALANRPAADANRFGEAPDEARANRSVVHPFEPGSTFKIVPMAAALELRRARPEERFDCEDGLWKSGGRTIRDVARHGVLSAREIIEESSNIGMAKIAARLQPAELADFIERFGFGQATGIELPGEARGEVGPPAAWSAYTRASLAFGQELAATALQVAGAFAVVANDGVRVPPRVVLGTIDSAGSFQQLPPPVAQRAISARTARELGSMLEGTIVRGTGRAAAVVGYRLAGKSGTAQKAVPGGYSERDFVASFAGYGPATSPRLVALVVLDSPRYGRHRGGSVAAPVFGRILADALAYLRVPTDEHPLAVSRRPAAEAPGRRSGDEPARPSAAALARRAGAGAFRASVLAPAAAAAGIVPDLQGLSLREALAHLAAAGLRARTAGSGVVVAQDPAAGTTLGRGAWCRLELGPRAD